MQQRLGSLKDAVEAYALSHGINDIDVLFPDARTITTVPEFISRRMEWVNKLLGGTRKSPFSRIKTLSADITVEEARAKGYIKGNFEEGRVLRSCQASDHSDHCLQEAEARS